MMGLGSSLGRECEEPGKVRHPFCVAFYGCSEGSGYLMTVKELRAGEGRRPALTSHPAAVLDRSREFVVNITSTLGHLHSQTTICQDAKQKEVSLNESNTQRASIEMHNIGLSKLWTTRCQKCQSSAAKRIYESRLSRGLVVHACMLM